MHFHAEAIVHPCSEAPFKTTASSRAKVLERHKLPSHRIAMTLRIPYTSEHAERVVQII